MASTTPTLGENLPPSVFKFKGLSDKPPSDFLAWQAQSLFPHLLSSWAVPNPSELEFANVYVDKMKKQLDGVKDNIFSLRSRINQLHKEAAFLETQLAINRCISSPWRRLPTEVFTRIMSLFVGNPEDADEFESSIVKERFTDRSHDGNLSRPLIIASVCKRWRDIVMGTPRLWSYLVIDFHRSRGWIHEELLSRCLIPQVQQYLLRSENADLDIIIYGPTAYVEICNDPVQHLTDILAPVSHRIRFMHIPVISLASLLDCTFPRLTSLSVAGSGKYNDRVYWPDNGAVQANILRNLRLRYRALLDVPRAIGAFPWQHLTRLTADVWDIPHLISQMAEMTNILHLDLRVTVKKDDGDSIGTQIQPLEDRGVTATSAKLESLRMRGKSFSRLLALLETPSLRYLEVDGDGGFSVAIERPPSSLPSFILNHHAPIETILPQLRYILLRNPVKELEIRSRGGDRWITASDIITHLWGDGYLRRIRIETLVLYHMRFAPEKVIESIETMVSELARGGHGSGLPLKTLRIVGSYAGLHTLDFRTALEWCRQRLAGRGLTIDVESLQEEVMLQ